MPARKVNLMSKPNRWSQGRSYALSLTVGFREQDDVGVGMAAEYAEALSVRRPTEIENLL